KDRNVAVPGEEELGSGQVVGPDAQKVAEPLDERPAAAVTEQVSEVPADGCAGKPEEDDQNQGVMARRGPRAGGEKQRLARKWNARALDENAQARGGIAERVDDPSPIQ